MGRLWEKNLVYKDFLSRGGKKFASCFGELFNGEMFDLIFFFLVIVVFQGRFLFLGVTILGLLGNIVYSLYGF